MSIIDIICFIITRGVLNINSIENWRRDELLFFRATGKYLHLWYFVLK